MVSGIDLESQMVGLQPDEWEYTGIHLSGKQSVFRNRRGIACVRGGTVIPIPIPENARMVKSKRRDSVYAVLCGGCRLLCDGSTQWCRNYL